MTLAEQLVGAARTMLQRGLVTSTVGNVSARCDGGLLITPTRRHPDELAPDDLVTVTLEGASDGGVPSLEWRMHAELYRARPDVGAIAHSHSPYAVARSFDPRPVVVQTEERSYFGLDRIEVARPAEAGSGELALAAVEALGARCAALLARHGAVAVGASPRDAVELCATVEQQAQIDWLLTLRQA